MAIAAKLTAERGKLPTVNAAQQAAIAIAKKRKEARFKSC